MVAYTCRIHCPGKYIYLDKFPRIAKLKIPGFTIWWFYQIDDCRKSCTKLASAMECRWSYCSGMDQKKKSHKTLKMLKNQQLLLIHICSDPELVVVVNVRGRMILMEGEPIESLKSYWADRWIQENTVSDENTAEWIGVDCQFQERWQRHLGVQKGRRLILLSREKKYADYNMMNCSQVQGGGITRIYFCRLSLHSAVDYFDDKESGT